MWVKECPRCTEGDVFIDQDGFKHCVTCGHIQYPGKSADIRAVLAETVVIKYTQREALSTAFG
jgi:uncharacterized protein (DUF983 family)